MIRIVLFFLLTHFTVGLLFSITWISLKEIGALFFRVTTLVGFALILLSLLANPFGNINLLSSIQLNPASGLIWEKLTYLFFILSALFLILSNILNFKLNKILLVISLLCGILGIVSFTTVLAHDKGLNPSEYTVTLINGLSAGLLLGATLSAMITGHWYLVNHKLSINSLKTSSKIYLVSVFLRLAVFIVSMIVFWGIDQNITPIKLLTIFDINGYLFYTRIVIGLIIPLIFGFMLSGSVKLHSTQSATGILYASIVIVLVGETFSKFLYFSTGIPF